MAMSKPPRHTKQHHSKKVKYRKRSRLHKNSANTSSKLFLSLIIFSFCILALMFLFAQALGSGSHSKPLWLSSVRGAKDAIPLGEVTVTHYSHEDDDGIWGRWTASGHILTDYDAGRVCAVSRDWWKSLIKEGDSIWVEGYAEPCQALDTMAFHNSNGMHQTRWIDIYDPDVESAREFGLKTARAYLIK